MSTPVLAQRLDEAGFAVASTEVVAGGLIGAASSPPGGALLGAALARELAGS